MPTIFLLTVNNKTDRLNQLNPKKMVVIDVKKLTQSSFSLTTGAFVASTMTPPTTPCNGDSARHRKAPTTPQGMKPNDPHISELKSVIK